jgi:hypothetical protein
MQNKKGKKLFSVITLFLIGLFLLPFCVAKISSEPSVGVHAPGAPSNALQSNQTNITPRNQLEQIKAMTTNVFAYRNVTLMLNCTRNCDLNVTVDEAVKPRILSFSIEPNQNVSLTVNMSDSPPSGERVLERTLNFYLGIEPNATLELQAQIRLHINVTELNQELNRVLNTSRLTWMYWNTSGLSWVPVESYIDDNGYLVCNTTHFSTWTVAETETTQLPEPTATPAPIVTSAPTSTPASSSSPSTSPSESAQPSLSASPSPSQAASPMQSQLPSPSPSTITEQESTSSTNTPTEYLYLAIAVAIVAVVAVSIVIIKKKAK